MQKITIGLVGARGYVGREIVAVLAKHPRFAVSFVVSRTQAGQPVAEHLPGAPADLVFEDLGPEEVARKGVDAVVLALSNGQAEPYVAAIDRVRAETAIVDVSADYRFHSTWVYGLPELARGRLRGARRIANPGCYATAMTLALTPALDLIDGPAHACGVSGYSGAGATPSPRNDVDLLRDNLMPYSVVGHVHEREVSHHVTPVCFVPHVAPFFRGITMTASFAVRKQPSTLALRHMYESYYAEEPMVTVTEEIPLVRDAVGKPGAAVGGIIMHPAGGRAVVVATLDNLLKGAASQAVQNLNLAFDLPETMGILPWQS